MTTVPNTTAPSEADNERRAAVIRGLRELADFYSTHPDFPVPECPDFRHSFSATDDRAGVLGIDAMAEALGAEVREASGGDHYGVEHRFAGVTFSAWYIHRDHMRQYNRDQEYLGAWKEAGRPPLAPGEVEPEPCEAWLTNAVLGSGEHHCALDAAHDGDHECVDCALLWADEQSDREPNPALCPCVEPAEDAAVPA